MSANQIKQTIEVVNRWIWLVIPVTFLVDLAHFFLLGRFKLIAKFLGPSNWVLQAFGLTTMTILPMVFVLVSGALPLSRRLVVGALLVGVLFSWYLVFIEINFIWIDISLTVLIPLGVLVAIRAAYVTWTDRHNATWEHGWAHLYWRIFWLCAVLALGVSSFLEITPVIFPGTYDYQMHHIDAAFGNPAEKLTAWVGSLPLAVRQFLTMLYDLIGWIYIPLIALVIRENKGEALNIWRTYIYALGLAMFCYAFIPMSGPLYAFGPDLFPNKMGESLHIPSVVTTIQPALRNGMPSMHFTSAASIAFICAALKNKWYFVASLLFLVGTVVATMGFGEHYLIDLVVALTYSATISIVLMGPKKYLAQGLVARLALGLAAATFLLWMLMFKFAGDWLINSLIVVKILTGWSVALFLSVWYFHVRAVWRLESDSIEPWCPPSVRILLPEGLKNNYWTIGVFFASGAAGLIYEVVFAKALAVTFGASSLAVNTVLATYMGGMALGAWLGAKFAQRSASPLRLYALCEALIGLYALLTPSLFKLIQYVYIELALNRPADAPELTILRLILGSAVLCPPTLLMGATFPIMFARLRRLGVTSERAIAPLYAGNVMGAAFGALFAGYALIPAVGKKSATYIAALISLLIALYALERLKNGSEANCQAAPEPEKPEFVVRPAVGVAALIILAVGGAATMGLEVLFMHMLAVVAGNSVYAFGLMLATFLLGLGLGSAAGEKILTYLQREDAVILAQCGLVTAIVTSSLQWDALANYFSHFGGYGALGIHITFSAREFIRALVCMLAMLPSAFFIGMSYPACMGLATDWLGRHGAEVSSMGKASAINTVGNISGVLITGFWLLPTLGSRNALLIIALTALASGAFMVLVTSWGIQKNMSISKKWLNNWAPLMIALAFIALFPAHWNLDKLSEGSNVYFYPQEWGKVIDHAESAEGGLTTVARSRDGVLTLLTNGKFQGNNSEHGEMVAQKSFALIPMLHTTQRDAALVIGYGTGMTPRVVYENGFRSLDIAELSEDMVTLANRYFENINHAVTSKPGVSTYFTDGRNFLLTQSKRYDLISIEITSIWFAGAANLYNKEFYELAAGRLSQQGVLQQWIQLHHMQPLDFLHAVASLRSSFKYVWFYVSGGQGIIVAANSPVAAPDDNKKRLLEKTMQDKDLTVQDLERTLLADPQQIDAMLSHFDPSMQGLISTDNNLYLEYATPKGNAVKYDSTKEIIRILAKKY